MSFVDEKGGIDGRYVYGKYLKVEITYRTSDDLYSKQGRTD
jgi:hypothetical protein